MPTLIDTYNCIHAGLAFGGAASGLTVRQLCRLIVAYPKPQRATLVLDGRPKPDEPSLNEFPEITLRYSGTGVSADSVIAQLVEKSGNRKQLIVVTNDRAVARHARSAGAATLSCETYLKLLIAPPPGHRKNNDAASPQKSQGLSTPGESDLWLQEFGFTPPPRPAVPPASTTDDDDPDHLDLRGLLD